MVREKLKERRRSLTECVKHTLASGDEMKVFVTFGVDDEAQIKEVFCAEPTNKGSDMHAIIQDACILLSLHLQTGAEIEHLIRSLGQNREPGQEEGRPSSVIGSVAHKLLDVQNYINKPEAT